PLAAAVSFHHTDWPPLLDAWGISLVSRVAPTLEPVAVALAPTVVAPENGLFELLVPPGVVTSRVIVVAHDVLVMLAATPLAAPEYRLLFGLVRGPHDWLWALPG